MLSLLLFTFIVAAAALNIGSDPKTWTPPTKCTICVQAIKVVHNNERVVSGALMALCTKCEEPEKCNMVVSYAMAIVNTTAPIDICKLLEVC